MTRRKPGLVEGLEIARRTRVDGTGGGRYRPATPHYPRPIGGNTQVITPSAGPSALIDALTLTANSQSIADTSDDVTLHNELVGLTPRAGFAGYGGTPTDTIIVPADGQLFVNVWASWDAFSGGGQMVLHITRGSQTLTRNLPGPADAGQHWHGQAPRITVKTGDVLRLRIEQTSGSAQTLASATVELTLFHTAVRTVGETLVGTLWVDTRQHDLASPVSSSYVLVNGRNYRLRVEGNHAIREEALTRGSPDAIIYPSPGGSATLAEHDYDVRYADTTGTTGDLPRHNPLDLMLDIGSGLTHIEPAGGPYSSPQAGHIYDVPVIGQGSVLRGGIDDSPLSDNNGMYRIDIYEAA